MLGHPRVVGRALEGDVQRQLDARSRQAAARLSTSRARRCKAGCPRGGRRWPTGCRRRRARPRPCCCGPCGGRGRSGGSAAGRRRRSPGRRRSRGDRWRRSTCRLGRRVERGAGKNSYQALNRPRSGSMSTVSGPDVAVGSRSAYCQNSNPQWDHRACPWALRRCRRRGLRAWRCRPSVWDAPLALEQAGDDALALHQLDVHVDAGLDLLQQAVLPRRRPVGPPEHLVLDVTELDWEERGAPAVVAFGEHPLLAPLGSLPAALTCANATRR